MVAEFLLGSKTPALAEKSRNTEVVRANINRTGYDMTDFKKDFLELCPWVLVKFPSLHKSTLRHLMVAPHLGRKAAKAYRGLIKTKLVHGSNSLKDETP